MKFFNLTMLLILITSQALCAQGFSSVYTRLTDCKLIESSSEEAGYALEECPGREDYRIFIESGEARSWLAIKKGKQPRVDFQHEVNIIANPGFFPVVSGEVAEWRYQGKIPIALIFRVSGTKEIYKDNNSTPMYKEKSKLLVIRLKNEKMCLIGTTTSNVEAREIADSKKTCP
jgi:hypothetical protein